MIKRLIDPKEFEKAVRDIFVLFDFENDNQGHYLLKHDEEGIIKSFAHPQILTWDLLVWGHQNPEGNYDALIAFANQKNEKFGERIFTEYIWLSKNPKVGYQLFKTAVAEARKKEFKYIIMGVTMANPNHKKVARFYEKMGFLKDSETYIARL
jgi:GNAT superfamily N-acetyltransferase